MKTPAFQWPGAKARLRAWILQALRKRGGTYLEPFAGRGNVFFAARRELRFERWHLNDLHTAPFLRALQAIDPASLPELIDRATFERLKEDASSLVSRVVEPRVTHFGKGWRSGFKSSTAKPSPSGRNYIGYSGRCYRAVVAIARELLRDAIVTSSHWRALAWGELGPDDFAYLDPPYIGTDVGYGQIDHNELLDVLICARFPWVLSGYDSPLYRARLGAPTHARTRHAEMTGRAGETRTECLWACEPFALDPFELDPVELDPFELDELDPFEN